MSKTETQSEALRLARLLESGCWLPVGHGDPIDEAAAELRRLDARVKSLEFSFNEWHDKTDWVQDTAQALELGMHRADVLRARIEALDAENKALRARLEISPSHPIDGIDARDETIRQLEAQVKSAAEAERERICAAIKAEDDYCVTQGDYMLDSDDCIKVARGEWERPVYEVEAAAKTGDAA